MAEPLQRVDADDEGSFGNLEADDAGVDVLRDDLVALERRVERGDFDLEVAEGGRRLEARVLSGEG